jgi:hypothetical protein
MFGWNKKKLDDLMARLRPDLSRESLGVGPQADLTRGRWPDPRGVSGRGRTF